MDGRLAVLVASMLVAVALGACSSAAPKAGGSPAHSPAVSGTATPATGTARAGFTWAEHTSPRFGVTFSDQLSCPAVTFCAAVSGTALTTFNGKAWKPLTADDAFTAAEAAVSCSAPTFCLAVSGNGVFKTWNGSAWSPAATEPLGPTVNRSSISCASAAFCMVVDGEQSLTTGLGTTRYATWTGVTWTAATTLASLLISGVSCVSATFCMGVGETTSPGTSAGGYVAGDIGLVWQGSAWGSPLSIGSGGSGIGGTGQVSCASPAFCMAVGGYHASGDQFALWNGMAWSAESQDPGTAKDSAVGFDSVSCPSTTECVAVDGGAGTNSAPSTFRPPAIAVWSAGTWSGPPAQQVGDVSQDACPSVTRCLVVGSGGYWIGTG